MYTVKQISDLAAVSVRTLHYYDEIGLLKPSSLGENGYRYYGEEALLMLQQILFFRELDLGLLQIKEIIESPEFDLVAALHTHRHTLQEKVNRLQCLINTVDSTIIHLVGEVNMNQKQLFAGFSEEKQKQYEQEISEKYGKETVESSVKRWNGYTRQQKDTIKAESNAIYTDLLSHMGRGIESPEVQAVLARWHQHLRYFYEPSPERLRGLRHFYNEHPDFIATFEKLHPDLPKFLEQAITYYCDHLADSA